MFLYCELEADASVEIKNILLIFSYLSRIKVTLQEIQSFSFLLKKLAVMANTDFIADANRNIDHKFYFKHSPRSKQASRLLL